MKYLKEIETLNEYKDMVLGDNLPHPNVAKIDDVPATESFFNPQVNYVTTGASCPIVDADATSATVHYTADKYIKISNGENLDAETTIEGSFDVEFSVNPGTGQREITGTTEINGYVINWEVPQKGDNSIIAVYNVTSTSSATKLYDSYWCKFSSGDCTIYVDGIEIPLSSAYTFSTTGEHIVKFKFNKQLTDCVGMFSNCSGLTNLDLSKFNTSNVIYMYDMFGSCSGLISLNLSGFDTSKVTNMSWMFNGCTNLTSLDLSNWNTSKVTSKSYMFNACGSSASPQAFEVTYNSTTASNITTGTEAPTYTVWNDIAATA